MTIVRWLACAVLLTLLPNSAQADRIEVNWTDMPDQQWIGADFWANRLQDWAIQDGTLVCVETRPLPLRTAHLLTASIDASVERAVVLDIGIEFQTDPDQQLKADGFAGVLVGVGDGVMNPRSAALIHGFCGPGAGYFFGIRADGTPFIHDCTKPLPEPDPDAAGVAPPEPVRLAIGFPTIGADTVQAVVHSVRESDNSTIGLLQVDLPRAVIDGGMALVSHPGSRDSEGAVARARFHRFISIGDAVVSQPEERLGPILSTQYTISRGTLKLTAQMMPIAEPRMQVVTLHIKPDDEWLEVDMASIDPESLTASFRVDEWDASRAVPYEVRMDDERYRGTFAADPVAKDRITLAAMSCNHNNSHNLVGGWGATSSERRGDWLHEMWFPHDDLTTRIAMHEPDLLFFAGDQIYEGGSPSFADRQNLRLDYLYKWYLWCWAYRDLTRDIPCIVIPDDHDVYQGNLWGAGGRATDRDNKGGYVHSASFVRMVERTQTSHLPDPFDGTPIDQGIGVYYTDLVWGRVSFAILEDRKFKSGCNDPLLPPSGTGRPDHFNDPDFDTAALDMPHLQLLGERQHDFLRHWAADWKGVDMKAALSQTIFANMATHHGKNLTELRADLDSNGWPQTGRRQALELLRIVGAVHIGGDQHLASLTQHGLDDWKDASWSFCVPATANFYPRAWRPRAEGLNRGDGPRWSGDHRDGFGNRITVHAVTNPRSMGREPKSLHDGMPGYGIVTFERSARAIEFNCWPRYAIPGEDSQYAGWPRRVGQWDMDWWGTRGEGPRFRVTGLSDPVVRVYDEATDALVLATRQISEEFTVGLPAEGSFRVEIGSPRTGAWHRFSGLTAASGSERRMFPVDFHGD